jgi:hypothetical protein
VSTDCARDMGSLMISTIGGPSLTEDTTEGRTECCVGVRGDESTTEAGDASEHEGECPRAWPAGSGGIEVASESIVYSDGALVFILTGVDDRPEGRAHAGLAVLFLAGLAVLCLTGRRGDFARTVLGCDPVVEVRSVPSKSPSRTLEREAARGPAWEVMRVPLSTLWRCGSMSRRISSAFFRRMLFALAVLRRSAAVAAASGGLGGGRGGVGAARLGGRGATRGSSSLSWSTSVAWGAMAALARAGSSRAYMLSFACVLERVGYDRLLLEAFAEPSEPRRAISGTTAIFCDLDDCDDDDVRTRSVEGRSRGRSPSASSLLDAEERVFRGLELLWRSLSFSRSRSRSRSLLLGLPDSFLLRRRWVSDELIVSVGGMCVGPR